MTGKLQPISKASKEGADALDTSVESSDEILCTICANLIVNYIPKFCLGEPFRPACDKCDDGSWESDDNLFDCENNSTANPQPQRFEEGSEFESESEFKKQEVIDNFIEYVRNFMLQEPTETLDNQIEKLQTLKRLLEPEGSDDSLFDEVIDKIKTLQDALENIKDDDEELFDYVDYCDEEDVPPH